MRRYQKQLTVTAASAALLAAIGAAMAQQTAIPEGGPNSGQSNNERLTGIQDNTNNSYKTFPESLNAPAAPSSTRATTAPSTRSQAAPDSGAATSSQTTSTTSSDSGYAANPDTSAATPAPRSDRN